ncbi:DUF257 family protein [Pyrococcus abyssi]|uniref:Uncharacterized protein n=1 Tax=Pyrococcus abyssi (strain GE5 / Orsay) TaxID=272844 RepID=Q9UZQ0_PYRAB|nr:DUF257 family protein [Pyrococcus abyssi]CAB50006.1 Hypothetical protein PAB1640 [Pyrococcus abyssi GE5]CCE70508.1 TPA: hypothetical protein PAB1640 [Pyrococcus abyssi GE5]
MVSEFYEFLENKHYGETVLIENSSILGVEAILLLLIKHYRNKSIPVLIEDILDTFPLYLKHITLMGVKLDMSNVKVMKIGGSEDVGNITSKIKMESDPSMYLSRYGNEFQRVSPQENFIDIVLGFDRLFVLDSASSLTMEVLKAAKSYTLRKNRLAFYIVEKGMLENLSPSPLVILENLATSVLELSQDRNLLIIKFLKDPWAFRSGIKEISIPLEDIF